MARARASERHRIPINLLAVERGAAYLRRFGVPSSGSADPGRVRRETDVRTYLYGVTLTQKLRLSPLLTHDFSLCHNDARHGASCSRLRGDGGL